MTSSDTLLATGRRKSAVARVKLKPGSGNYVVNNRPLNEYLPTEELREHALQSMRASNKEKEYDAYILTLGGGLNGQAGAIRLGLTRALILAEPTLRGPLKKEGFLTRDPRMRERKKPGQPGARRRFQFSKR
jgi:small subunit ribosomal protein S9